MITEYEDNGDIVEVAYTVLDRLLRLSNGNAEHANVKVMDQSKQLLRQAFKHSAVYQCQESYTFLCQLINSSSRFKNKAEMEQALAKIAPPSMQNTDLEQQTTFNNSVARTATPAPKPDATINTNATPLTDAAGSFAQ